MRAGEILDLAELSFLEPSFASLTDDIWTDALLAIPATRVKLLVDMAGDPLAVAVFDGKAWFVASFLFRRPTLEVIELCENLDGDIHEDERSAWLGAVREYYSLLIRRSVTPALEDLQPERPGRIRDLLRELWGEGNPVPCLDCCCGSGAGSAAARVLGMHPISYDNDPALLSLGLAAGRLLPEETMWIDASVAGHYIDPVPRGIAVMMGEINTFTREEWREITGELLALVDEAVITVGTEAEVREVEGWCGASGHEAEVTENRRDEFYDRWVCRTSRRS